MATTQALPMNPEARITQAHRIAVGMRKGGKGAPQKLDHFLLTRYSPQAKGYVVDVDAMQALAAYLERMKASASPERLAMLKQVDPAKPKRLPIELYYNLVPDEEGRLQVPDTILFTRMAFYWGSRCQCSSEGFRLKNAEECKADKLDFPPDPARRESWIGEARIRKYDDGRLVAERVRPCNPMTCKLATGTHGQAGYEGMILCKPQSIFSCALPFLPRLGVAAKLVTTSWQTTDKLRSSLLVIGAHSRGWLAKIPLDLCVTVERVNTQGYTSPICHIEYAGDMEQLQAQVVRVQGNLSGLEHEMARLSASAPPMRALDSGEEAQAFAREFAHETAEETRPPAIEFTAEAYMEELAEEAGWTDARKQQALDEAGDDEDEVIATLEREVGIVEDAEYTEEPPAEVYEDPFPDAPENQRLIEEGEDR